MSVFFIPLLNENFKKSSTVLLSEKLVLFGKLLVPSELLKNGARSAGYIKPYQSNIIQHFRPLLFRMVLDQSKLTQNHYSVTEGHPIRLQQSNLSFFEYIFCGAWDVFYDQLVQGLKPRNLRSRSDHPLQWVIYRIFECFPNFRFFQTARYFLIPSLLQLLANRNIQNGQHRKPFHASIK